MPSITTARNRIFYALKPLIPRSLQLWLRRSLVAAQRHSMSDVWPILPSAARPPAGWQGWPEGKRFALVLAHDVEWDHGQRRVLDLMRLEQMRGFRSSFNFVPRRYDVQPAIRAALEINGFEVGVHGLYHDGKLFESRATFLQRVPAINHYLAEWGAVGFCSPASHHNLEWTHDLQIEYDSSTFDTDPFEAQSDGLGTIFPQWISPSEGAADHAAGYVELPYTLPQDFTLFVLMRERSIDIWQRKLDWIAEQGGMAFLITHPDYMAFDNQPRGPEEYPLECYLEFLEYVRTRYAGQYWHGLPREVAAYVKARLFAMPAASMFPVGENSL